jgi:hypothetical protein
MASDNQKKKSTAKDKEASGSESSKPATGESVSKPSSYSRGENQKPVTQAYRDNWNMIFGKRKRKR